MQTSTTIDQDNPATETAATLYEITKCNYYSIDLQQTVYNELTHLDEIGHITSLGAGYMLETANRILNKQMELIQRLTESMGAEVSACKTTMENICDFPEDNLPISKISNSDLRSTKHA